MEEVREEEAGAEEAAAGAAAEAGVFAEARARVGLGRQGRAGLRKLVFALTAEQLCLIKQAFLVFAQNARDVKPPWLANFSTKNRFLKKLCRYRQTS